MPILGCREAPPNPSVLRSKPAREWGLCESASIGAPFASPIFEHDDTHAALQTLASVLFDARRQRRGGGSSSERGSRGQLSPGGRDHQLSFAFLQPQQPQQWSQPQQPAAQAHAQGQQEEITDLTLDRAGRGAGEDADGRRSRSRDDQLRPKAGGGVEALADDDFDFQFSSKPAQRKAVLPCGRDAPQSAENHRLGLDVLPSNHYEQICDVWDRAIVPAGGLVSSLQSGGGAQDAAENGKQDGGRKREGKQDSGAASARGKGASGKKGAGAAGGGSSIAPFFGGVGREAGAGNADTGRKEQNKCSICQQPGHSKRTCPSAEAGGSGNAPEAKKRRSKSAGDAPAEPVQSVQEKLQQISRVATNLGTLEGKTGLNALFHRVASCTSVAFGVLYTNNDTNLREKTRKGVVEREPMGCCLLLPDHAAEEDERAANIFVPFLQAQGFTTTLEERREFLQRLFSSEVACPLVCFHAKPCLMALAAFVRFQPPFFREAPVCCIKLSKWLLDPDLDPTSVSFDAFCQDALSINPFSSAEEDPGGSKEQGGAKASAEAGSAKSTLNDNFCRVLYQDLGLCAQMWDLMVAELQARDMEGAASLEMSLIPVICLMEEAGIGFSPTQLIRQRRAMERKLLQLEEEATKLVGHPVLLTSPQQLCSVLFEELQLPPPANGLSASTAANSTSKFKGAHQQYSTNEEVPVPPRLRHGLLTLETTPKS